MITVPASMLQPPIFNADADDAANYGAIGALMGHELSHALDDRGQGYDARGMPRPWWTPPDLQRFRESARIVAEQYDAYTPLPGLRVNGDFTLTENLADVTGVSMAYRAYLLSLKGQSAPVLRRLHRSATVLHGLGGDVAIEGARRLHAAVAADPAARAVRVPRERTGEPPAGVLRGVWRHGRGQAVPIAGHARADVVKRRLALDHSCDPVEVLRKIPFDDRQLERPQDCFLWLPFQQEQERGLEQCLRRRIRGVARHVGRPDRHLVPRGATTVIDDDVVDRAGPVGDVDSRHDFFALDFRLKAEATRFFLADSWLPASAGRPACDTDSIATVH
jgi:Peptidase family M13